MADLSGLHSTATRLILAIRDGLERLEAAESGTRGGDPSSMARELQQKVQDLQRISQELDSNWRMQVVRQNATKRDVWKRKVEQVSEELDLIRTALDKYGNREQRRQREVQDRAELMERAEMGRQMKSEMDEEAAAMGHVRSSKRMLQEMFDTGTGILETMGANRERIKSAQKRVLDVINSVGLGDRALRLIERRHKQDLYIAYGGMAAITVFIILILWWRWS